MAAIPGVLLRLYQHESDMLYTGLGLTYQVLRFRQDGTHYECSPHTPEATTPRLMREESISSGGHRHENHPRQNNCNTEDCMESFNQYLALMRKYHTMHVLLAVG